MSAGMKGLEERLRHRSGISRYMGDLDTQEIVGHSLLNEAADRIATLEAEVVRLRGANLDARSALSEASCWLTTKGWSASDFREHVRAAHLHQAKLSNARARDRAALAAGEG